MTSNDDQESNRAADKGQRAVVGVGASAGGLEALEQLFANMPVDTGAAFVVITHLPPGHKSLLPEILAKSTDMPVLAAADGTKVEANHVYIGPPGGQLAIANGCLRRLEVGNVDAPRMPIDHFFRSLAHDQQQRSICIVLSGTGTDGTLGLREIKGASGMVMVEDPTSAKYEGMPTSALSTGLADFVLPPAQMPEQLVRYLNSPYLREVIADTPEQSFPAEPLQEIFSLLHHHTGHDFSAYKSNTLHRRIARRMNLHQIATYDQYIRYLKENTGEIDLLFRELLISVTNFFRDPEVWEAMRPLVEERIASLPPGSSFRVWVPGCSSGEEVFTVAILLRECMDASKRSMDVQVFGTDLDARAIDRARAGRYPEGIAVDLTPQRLKRFFIMEDGYYRIHKSIREMTVFAPQNAIKDPPFTRMDIISCRNMLIYLNSALQRKLLPVFHYALKPGGLLLLGTSETVGSLTELFEPVDKRWKIFRRREKASGIPPLPEFPLQIAREGTGSPEKTRGASMAGEARIQKRMEHALLERFAPPCVVVDTRGDIVYLHGRTGTFLEPSEGQPRNNLLEMAREGLRIELAEALRKCVADDTEVLRKGIRVKSNGGHTAVDLSVTRLERPEPLRGLLLVAFQPPSPTSSGAGDPGLDTQNAAGDYSRIESLERALEFMRETHQTTLEDLETANEELESTNEELQSTNEELQSTNEELETSKEEMQSLNEELTTVNAELLAKVEELSQANHDMQNLLNSTKIATVFLDAELRIKRFTDQARELVLLRPADIGRPISELASKLQHEDLPADCQGVLRTLVFKEAEVQSSDGAYYLMRIMPYRTAGNAIDGLVLTFVDISLLKRTQSDLRHMSEVFRDGVDPTIIVDLNGTVLDVNHAAVQVYGYTRESMLGRSFAAINSGAQLAGAQSLLERCRDGERIRNLRWTLLNRSGDEVGVSLTMAVLTAEQGQPDAIAITARQLPAGTSQGG